jgi:hypothetical protein
MRKLMQASHGNGSDRIHWTDERLDRFADIVERYIIASGDRFLFPVGQLGICRVIRVYSRHQILQLVHKS